MHTGVVEDRAEDLGGAVDDAGLSEEGRVGGDEPDDLDDPDTRSSEPITSATAARALIAAVRAQSLATSRETSAPTLPSAGSVAVDEGQRAGGEDQVAAEDRRDVDPGRRRSAVRDRDAQGVEAGLDIGHRPALLRDEVEDVLVELGLVVAVDAVRRARVDLQGAVLDQLDRLLAAAAIGTIWSSSPCAMKIGTSSALRSSVKSVSENALTQS